MIGVKKNWELCQHNRRIFGNNKINNVIIINSTFTEVIFPFTCCSTLEKMAESAGTGGNASDPGPSDSGPSGLNTSVEREEPNSEEC